MHEECISGEKYVHVPVGETRCSNLNQALLAGKYPGLQAKKYNSRIPLLVRNMHA